MKILKVLDYMLFYKVILIHISQGKPRRAFVIQGETMPRKPKRPCSHHGCPNLTDGRFCIEHQREENKRYEKYERNPSTSRRYGIAWKRIRDSYVKEHPYCEECFKKGIMVPVEEVHHIKSLSEGGNHNKDNLISLCKSCHGKIYWQANII